MPTATSRSVEMVESAAVDTRVCGGGYPGYPFWVPPRAQGASSDVANDGTVADDTLADDTVADGGAATPHSFEMVVSESATATPRSFEMVESATAQDVAVTAQGVTVTVTAQNDVTLTVTVLAQDDASGDNHV